MMSRFFIFRPIFAWVLAVFAMLCGALSLLNLPVSQYPNISAPAIMISAIYPGASAEAVQTNVVKVIEPQLNGLDGFRYMSATSNIDGSMELIVTFEQGTDPDVAQVQVQNKLQLATPNLPEEVQRQGVRVVKYQINFMQVIALIDKSGTYDSLALGDLIASKIQDPISRVPGVGDFILLGSQGAMRIWLDPAKLRSFDLTPSEVAQAIREENVQISAGQLGGLPSLEHVQLNASVLGSSRMSSVEEFEEIFLKVNTDGAQVRLKDVAKVELGADNFSITGKYSGLPSAGLALRLAPGANIIETVEGINNTLEEIKGQLPEGIEVVVPYDTLPSVHASIDSVITTIIEAIVLVFLVMYLFLQNMRATIIPTLAIPVVLLGTFALLPLFDITINVLSMYAMVLAIGLLVDDAIVVVENVERLIHEEGLSAKDATVKSMGQISGALVGIGLVLSAVFVPMAFFGGASGIIYKQFAVTVVVCMSLSVLVALIFTPALCATILKPSREHDSPPRFFTWFNNMFNRTNLRFERGVKGILAHRGKYLVVFALITAGTGYLFTGLPKSFLPGEDQGLLIIDVRLAANASAERTESVLSEIKDQLLTAEADAVESVFTVNGFNFAGRGQNSGLVFVELKDWDERKAEGLDVFSVTSRTQYRLFQINDTQAFAFVPPAILELGNAMGFEMSILDLANKGHSELMQARNQFLQMANQHPSLVAVRPNGREDEAQYRIIVDREKAKALGVSLAAVNETLSAAWGSMYVNDFVDSGRVKRVYIQGVAGDRMSPEDFEKWYVKNRAGEMVPFSAFSSGVWEKGSPKLERLDGFSSVQVLGQPSAGLSTGDAITAVHEIMDKLPEGFGVKFTGMSYEEIKTGDLAPALYALTVLIIFLCLAAMYESWTVPVSVMLVFPIGALGAIVATLLRDLSADVYFQVGLMTTLGLTAKNAILIVEFAKKLYEEDGRTLVEAAVEAARLRLRPIVMTSLAFSLGVLPMALATGAGAGSQQSVATGILGGTITATVLAIFFVPLFFVMVIKLVERFKNSKKEGVQK